MGDDCTLEMGGGVWGNIDVVLYHYLMPPIKKVQRLELGAPKILELLAKSHFSNKQINLFYTSNYTTCIIKLK